MVLPKHYRKNPNRIAAFSVTLLCFENKYPDTDNVHMFIFLSKCVVSKTMIRTVQVYNVP